MPTFTRPSSFSSLVEKVTAGGPYTEAAIEKSAHLSQSTGIQMPTPPFTAQKLSKISSPYYSPLPPTTKFITYKVVPTVRRSVPGKKRSIHHSKNCQRRRRRRALALLLHRKHHSKTFCRKVCKALIYKRGQRSRAVVHRKRPSKK